MDTLIKETEIFALYRSGKWYQVRVIDGPLLMSFNIDNVSFPREFSRWIEDVKEELDALAEEGLSGGTEAEV